MSAAAVIRIVQIAEEFERTQIIKTTFRQAAFILIDGELMAGVS